MTDHEQETSNHRDNEPSEHEFQGFSSDGRKTAEAEAETEAKAHTQQQEHKISGKLGNRDNRENQNIWPQLRKLLVFQFKLYIDAARDLLMSPMSIVVFIIDVVQGNQDKDSLFESLLQIGRRTEKAINLFNQHNVSDENIRGIDSILLHVEDAVRREYTEGSVSANARDSIEKSLDRLRTSLKQSGKKD